MVISATDRWSVGQGVKTPPFHGGNTGSNPVRTIAKSCYIRSNFFCMIKTLF